jgi:hypothetical protein
MAGSFRRRIAAVGLSIASLFPNVNRVSFMGARSVTKAVVASVEAVGTRAEPVIEKVAQVASTNGGKAAAAGTLVTAGGAAAVAEKGCVFGAKSVKSAIEVAEHTRPSVVVEAGEGLGKAAAKGGSEIVEDIPKPKFPGGSPEPVPIEPRPGPGILVPLVEPPPAAVATRAVSEAGVRITSNTAASSVELADAKVLLDEQAIRMTENLLLRLPRAELQSHEAVAAAFKTGIVSSGKYRATFDAATGLVRMHLAKNGVVISAEFNAYSAAQAAAAVYAQTEMWKQQPRSLLGSGTGA